MRSQQLISHASPRKEGTTTRARPAMDLAMQAERRAATQTGPAFFRSVRSATGVRGPVIPYVGVKTHTHTKQKNTRLSRRLMVEEAKNVQ